jgi:hypothetical protein
MNGFATGEDRDVKLHDRATITGTVEAAGHGFPLSQDTPSSHRALANGMAHFSSSQAPSADDGMQAVKV